VSVSRIGALLLAVLAFAATAQAEPDVAGDLNETVTDQRGFVDGVVEGVGDAAEGVGDAVEQAGEGIGAAAGAVGRALAGAVRLVGDVAGAAITGLSVFGAFVATGTVDALAWVGRGLADTAGALGSGLTAGLVAGAVGLWKGAAFLATGLGRGVAWIAAGAWAGVLAYAGFVSDLRPEAVPAPVFAGVVATGTTATAGVGGWAGWNVLRRWGVLGGPLAGLGGFTRIQDQEVLEHPLRSEIFQAIQTNPGIHASQIAREVGAGWGTITHHLEKLEKARFVTTRRVNNQKCFFEQGGKISRQDMLIAGAVKGDTAANIVQYVESHPMTSQKSLAEALGISPALASFHVKKMVNLGVMEKVRHGKETLLTTTEAFRRLVASEDPGVAATVRRAEGLEYGS